MSRFGLVLSCWVLFVVCIPVAAQPGMRPPDAPLFRLRARVTRVQGKEPTGKKFTFGIARSKRASSTGTTWSDWIVFGPEERTATLKTYPAVYLRGYPVVTRLNVSGVLDPTEVEVELRFDEGGATIPLSGELYGPALGILLWREEGKPRADTMAGYNRRYWKVLEGVKIDVAHRPKHFPIVDRFIGGDQDRRAWKEGIEQLSRAGFSVLMLPASRPIRELLLATGLRRTSWAVYSPPGYAFAFDPKITPASIDDWAAKLAKPYLEAGYDRKDMALFALSDEPGWYFPRQFDGLKKSPVGMKRFREYLQAQKLQPADVGATSWDAVQPLGRSQAKDLASRRLFYWTMRFFAHDSARHFADCTRALEKVFQPGTPIFTNWNFFAGRLYVPGPVANNPDKKSPDAAMGGHDWLEFGRLRGGTMLWTEDWFADSKAFQWSYYCAHLRSAARAGGVEFGGYVIPRTAGGREEGIFQKILCVAGSGGKAIKYFVFGPEYNFPGNCYSERAKVLPKMAEAHRIIGTMEDVLWPGKPPRPAVAIVHPRSSQMWDAKDMVIAKGLSDATNSNLNARTVDYMAEVYDLYLALQHAGIPADIIDEDDLSPTGLKPYRVVYLTGPNVPAENQRGLLEWIRGGGTLVTVSAAAQRDRYDKPCGILAEGTGIAEKPRDRLLIASAATLKPVAQGTGPTGAFTAFGVRGAVSSGKAKVVASFEDKTPAVVEAVVGKGRRLHFAWLPGLSYFRSSTGTSDQLPVGFSAPLRALIALPVKDAGIVPPASTETPLVEAATLVSPKGMAVTLLNWTGAPVPKCRVTLRPAFPVRSVESAYRGKVSFRTVGKEVHLELPLGAADVLAVRP